MCLIVKIPQGKTLPDDIVESALLYNPDGFGYMVNGTAKKFVKRTAKQIKKLLKRHLHSEIVVHFRMATDGVVNKKLAHPHRLANGDMLMHNGILTQFRTDAKAVESDTTRFVSEYINPMLAETGDYNAEYIESAITGNRLAIMSADGRTTLFGDGWFELEGCTFSNSYAFDTRGYIEWEKSDSSEYGFDRDEWDDYSITETILADLEPVADSLPVYDYGFVASGDYELHDKLLWCKIDAMEYLRLCDPRTLLALYRYAIEYGLLHDYDTMSDEDLAEATPF